jgi:ribonuclease HI
MIFIHFNDVSPPSRTFGVPLSRELTVPAAPPDSSPAGTGPAEQSTALFGINRVIIPLYSVLRRRVTVIGYFDGASRGNPGEAGAGACLVDDSGKVVWECSEYLGIKTNNEAEYAALLRLLAHARSLGAAELEVRGDSKLVVSQVKREWKITKPHLRDLVERAWEMMSGMKVDLVWVPRENNKLADALSNRGIDEGRP